MTDFCRTNKFLHFFETSAKDGTNIGETFSFLVKDVRKKIKFLF
jgi:hypothetical protein